MTPPGLISSLLVLAAAIIAGGLIVLLRPLLRRYALARPNARSSHTEPTPQGGGIAVIAATIVITLAGAAILGLPVAAQRELALVCAATAFIAVVGVIDDIKSAPVLPRLFAQGAAAALVLAALPQELRVIAWLPWWPERLLLLIAMLWLVNLVNFMDGLDWMTVAEVVPLTAGLAYLGYLGALPAHGIVVALALLGAMIGFAPFNKPVARLFLGDVGSLPIGLLLGWLLLLVAAQGHVAAALLLPLYYLADATITLLRRVARREKVWDAHRSHFYQRARDRGMGVNAIVGRVFAVNVALAALAGISVAAPTPLVGIATFAMGGLLVGRLLVTFARGRT